MTPRRARGARSTNQWRGKQAWRPCCWRSSHLPWKNLFQRLKIHTFAFSRICWLGIRKCKSPLFWYDDGEFGCNFAYYFCRLHLNAGKFDLDNQFFLELATSQEWVSTKVLALFCYFGTILLDFLLCGKADLYMWTQHIEALVEYVANRHEEILKERRSIFLPPWFVTHLQGKASAFNAAKVNKGRVLADGRLSGFLTKEGRKWGAEVDTLYAPMIWDGNH